MLILGIDPGSQILGYSLLDTGKPLSIVEMDVLYLRRTPDFNERIFQIFHSVNDIIEAHHPDHLAIEAPFLGKNAQSMLKLGRAQGIAIAVALAHDIPYTEYEPTLIKRTVTGNGNASKEQVADLLRSILCFDEHPRYLDATDALAVAYTHFAVSSQQSVVNAARSDSGNLSLPTANKKHKSAKKQWSEFITQNPDLVK